VTGNNGALLTAVRGRVDNAGRLIEADPELDALHARAGGEQGGRLAIPQIAAIVRLARRLNIVISRAVLAADGEIDLDLWVRAQPVGNDVELAITGWSGRLAAAPAIASDVERELDFQRAAADWAWQTDEALRLTLVPAAAAAAVGKSPAALLGRPLTTLFRLVETPDGSLPILAALGEQNRFEDQVATLRGQDQARYILSGTPITAHDGRFAGFRGLAASLPLWLDIGGSDSERQPGIETSAFGERLERALRAPLADIVLQAETIGDQPAGPLRRDYATYAKDIAVAGRHLLELVDDLVDLYAVERPDFTPEAEAIDLADIARRAAGLLMVRASECAVRIDRPAQGVALPSTGEFKRVLQILMNLISNAIRYSPEGGTIAVRALARDTHACVEIIDKGKGISASDQDRIFEKFERLDPEEPGGTGLGLYIARRLARAMGGDVTVASAAGKGACFTLSMPLRR